jgi:hypothetical protein
MRSFAKHTARPRGDEGCAYRAGYHARRKEESACSTFPQTMSYSLYLPHSVSWYVSILFDLLWPDTFE